MQPSKPATVEDCVEHVVAANAAHSNSADSRFFKSIAAQLKSQRALTYRQHSALKARLQPYATDADFVAALEHTVAPYRAIDRSSWAKIVDYNGVRCVAVHYSFSYANAKVVQALAYAVQRAGTDAESNTHYFRMLPSTAAVILNSISEIPDIDIDAELVSYSETVQAVLDNPSQVLPGIDSNYCTVNTTAQAASYIQQTFGEISSSTLWKLYDRRMVLGLEWFDSAAVATSLQQLPPLASAIAQRTLPQIHISPDTVCRKTLAAAISSLDRFPLLVILRYESAIREYQTYFAGRTSVVHTGSTTVVDNTVEIVYTSEEQAADIFAHTAWEPIAILTDYCGKMKSTAEKLFERVDLVVHHDVLPSQIKRNTIETIKCPVAS